ncbi:MAG: SDR family oxidoreductase [Gammaproteobacteria bacterium]|nr:SDR family oxidoreductase [Gammaproteobacteria bacterium]
MTTLIIGANSDIAHALIKALAKKLGHNDFILASRNKENLARLAKDVQTRFAATVSTHYLDVTDFSSHQQFVDNLIELPDCIIYAAGYLGEQQTQQSDFSEAMKAINTNYSGAVSLIERLVEKMIAADSVGTVVGISSVAGERGRASNYIYGSTKAGFSSYLSGLRSRLHKHNIHVLTVVPGFVATKMTAQHQLPPLLTASAERVANDIVKAIAKRKNNIFTKPVWRYVMGIIRLIPEPIFKRSNL